MPLIQVNQASSQGPEKKRELIEAMTEAYARVTGMDASKVWVIVNEIPRDSWGTGGVPLADRDKS